MNHRGSRDTSLVYVVRNRADLLERVIPFFEQQPLVSTKQQDFLKFSVIVQAMAGGKHLSEAGFAELRELALSMNGGGRYRTVHRPESSETIRRTLDLTVG